jgi:hypothetical protein
MQQMKKLQVLVVGILIVITFFVPIVIAADTATITITVTASGTVSISVTPTTWAMGTLTLGSSNDTSSTYFTLSNDGDVRIDTQIKGSNSLDWSLVTGATGTDTFNITTNDTLAVQLTTSYQNFKQDLDPVTGNTYQFGLIFYMPTADTSGGAEQTITVTILAAQG